MAEFDFATNFRSAISEDGNSEQNGARPGSSDAQGSSQQTGAGTTGSEGRFDFSAGGTNGAQASADGPAKKRRGRQPYPRDANGNIIRPEGSTAANKSGKAGVDKVRNDRAKMQGQIDTLFKLAAQFTKMPHWMLSEQEAAIESEATCNLCDAMGWDLSKGTDSPLAAAVIFAVTTVSVVKPRIDETVRIANAIPIGPASPSTPGEARANGQARAGMVDFSADIDATAQQVNSGTTKPN